MGPAEISARAVSPREWAEEDDGDVALRAGPAVSERRGREDAGAIPVRKKKEWAVGRSVRERERDEGARAGLCFSFFFVLFFFFFFCFLFSFLYHFIYVVK